MEITKSRYVLLSVSAACLLLMATGFAVLSKRYHKEIPLTKEREVKVTLSAGLGNVNISRGSTSMLIEADVESEQDQEFADAFDYAVRDGVGYLNVDINDDNEDRKERKKKFSFHGFDSDRWSMQISDAIPISFDIELGFGSGHLDFTGLKVKDLNVSAGASSVTMRFDRPNQAVIENLNIESGLSKFRAEGLGNANFNHLKFEGGVGSYVLDFSGILKKEVDVDIEVGLGALTIIIPERVGAHIMYEKSWVSHCSIDNDFSEEEENNYYTANYASAIGRMNLRVESGLGTVVIKRQ